MVQIDHTELADLAPVERAVRYRQFAKQAEIWAENARTGELAASYRLLGAQWNKLADQITPANEDYPASTAIQGGQPAAQATTTRSGVETL
jgi:hypothetical protein